IFKSTALLINPSHHTPLLEGDNCLRTSDCAPGYCCARHFWDKICKRMPKEGEVCSKRGRKEVPQSHELFQRCECSPGLSCRLQSDNKDKQNSRLRVCLRTFTFFKR
uniref:Dickkopf WNT signaling pathway inhibitor 4 n=1 Tax=Erpetoichthys calabaricus TaxID=27687 RepID=A0A8C4RCK1_ERPCA